MEVIGGLETIFVDQLRPYRVASGNTFSRVHTFFTAVLPIVGGATVAALTGPFVATNAGSVLAAYALIASVLTAVMPTIHGLVGDVDPAKVKELETGSETSDDNIRLARLYIAKVETIRSLYAAAGWSVIVLAMALLPVLLLSHVAFQPDKTTGIDNVAGTPLFVRAALTGLAGYAGVTSIVALIQIVTGVHLMARDSQNEVARGLEVLKARYRL